MSHDHKHQMDLKELKTIIDAIFDHMINDLNITSLSIKDTRDYYWEVPTEPLYKVEEDQPQLDIGRLSDDWEFLKPILRDRKQAFSSMLIHAAPLLRWIGETIGQ